MSKRTSPKARVFVPLVKVDEDQRLVHGRITQEILDKSSEVMDYASSKPLFEKWSGDIHAASGGLSKGNVRVMHGLTAAGKLTDLDFNDVEQAIDVCAKIVDEAEWEKVLEGVYTGFSVGGSYAKRWTDENGVKKYTANPNEVSLVDNPCVPSATFQFAKADGTVEEVEFAVENNDDEWPAFAKAATAEEPELPEPVSEAAATDLKPHTAPGAAFEPTSAQTAERAEKMAKANGGVWGDHIEAARNELIAEHSALAKGEPANAAEGTEGKTAEEVAAGEDAGDKTADADATAAEPKVEKTTPAGVTQKWTASDGTAFDKKADAEEHEAKLVKGVVPESAADRLAKALKIATGQIEEAEEVIAPETVFTDFDRLHKAFVELDQPREANGAPALEKGMYTVRRFSDVLSDMASLSRSIKAGGQREGSDGNDSTVSSDLIGAVKTLGASFISYTTDQVAELLNGMDDDVMVTACDYYYNAAKDETENALAKDVAALIDSAKEKIDKGEVTLEKRAPVVTSDEEVVPLAKFAALETEHEKLQKVTAEAIDQITGLAKRVKQIEDTPNPRAPRNVVDKADERTIMGKTYTSEEAALAHVKQLVETHGTDGLATMLIKAAQSQPMTMGGGR